VNCVVDSTPIDRRAFDSELDPRARSNSA